MRKHEQIFVGIDGGGTGCRAVIATSDRVLGIGEAGPANVTSDPKGAVQCVLLALKEAGTAANVAELGNACAHIGLAGVINPQQADSVRLAMPFKAVAVTDDRPTTLAGALGQCDGSVAAIGTGSFVGLKRGTSFRFIGGWGLALGDEASAAWLGRSALSETLMSTDGLQAETDLTNAVLEKFGKDPNTIVEFATTATPADFGSFAPFVTSAAETGDLIASRLMESGASYIERSFAALKPTQDEPFCLTGGLGPSYSPYLSEAVQSVLQPADGSALDGALTLARAMN